MEEEKFYLTPEGYQKIKEELEYLKTVKRPEIIQKIKEAKEYGDISENIEYESAKDEQSLIEGRINELENILKKAVIIKGKEKGGSKEVRIGSKVLVECDGEKQEFTIVGKAEINPAEGKISNESPIGKALLGHVAGDVVKVNVPAGELVYKILKVS